MAANVSRMWCFAFSITSSGRSRLRASLIYVLSRAITGLTSAAATSGKHGNAAAALIHATRCNMLRRDSFVSPFTTSIGACSVTKIPAKIHLVGFGPGVGCCFFKTRESVAENEMNAIGGAVALFGDEKLGLGAFLGSFIGLESVRPIDKHDHVGVLFDGARFAQVGKLRATVFAFRGARKLRQHQHRNFQFFSQSL